jgi:hypothetical protein
MRRISLVSLVALVLAAAPVRADFMGWQYDWTASPTTIPTAGGGSLQLIGVSGSNTALSESVLAMGITAPAAAQQSAINPTPYQLTLTLTDTASNDSGSVTFNGTFSGSYSNLSNSYTGPTTKQILLGTNNYTVSLGAYYAPSSIFPGVLTAAISATPDPQTVPEPATLALAGCALPGLALAAWRRKASVERKPSV